MNLQDAILLSKEFTELMDPKDFTGSALGTLVFIKTVEEAHLIILQNDENFGGSEIEIRMGNLVHQLGLEHQIYQTEDENYCLKATATEIAELNLQRIAEAIQKMVKGK